MALFCDLYVETSFNFLEFIKKFFAWNALDAELELRAAGNPRQYFAVAAKERRFVVFSERAEQRNVDLSALHIKPTVNLKFIITSSDWLCTHEDIVQMALTMMEHVEGDVALIHGDCNVVLLRRANTLMLKRGEEFWTRERLDMITQPYQLNDIPRL